MAIADLLAEIRSASADYHEHHGGDAPDDSALTRPTDAWCRSASPDPHVPAPTGHSEPKRVVTLNRNNRASSPDAARSLSPKYTARWWRALGNNYSVPIEHVGAPVTVRVHRERIVIWRDAELLG